MALLQMVKGSTTVEEVSVLQMARGLVHRLRCTGDLQVTQEIFAHQVMDLGIDSVASSRVLGHLAEVEDCVH